MPVQLTLNGKVVIHVFQIYLLRPLLHEHSEGKYPLQESADLYFGSTLANFLICQMMIKLEQLYPLLGLVFFYYQKHDLLLPELKLQVPLFGLNKDSFGSFLLNHFETVRNNAY